MKQKFANALSLALIVAMLFTSVALADNVQNDVTTVGGVRLVTITASDGTGATVFYNIQQTSGDSTDTGGPSGERCNAADGSPAKVTPQGMPTGVSTSPSFVEFVNCTTAKGVTFVASSSTTPGDYVITVAVNDTEAVLGDYNTNPASLTLRVLPPPPPANTAPSIVVAGVTNGGVYDKGSVPAATCEVTDTEDGNSSFPAELSAITGPYASDGIGSQTASCSYTDAGGLNASASATYSIVDPSAPVLGYTLTPTDPDGSNGWYKGDVSLDWTVTEGESPSSLQLTGCDDQVITVDQLEMQYSCSATSAGGSVGPVSVSIKRDGTVPTISGSRSPAANGAGWNNTDVTVSFTCGDATSGVVSCSTPTTLSGEGAGQFVTGNATDNAGNTNSATVSGINIDKTAPSVALVGGPADGGSYYFGSVPAAPTCSAEDNLSGLAAPCSVSGYGTTVGDHTVIASASDNAGNSASASASYTVLAWTLNGFYQPVDMGGVFNVVKGGSTVPLKFEVFSGSIELTATSVVKSFTVVGVACNSATADDIELTTTGGTSLRYDATAGQFIQNWQTPRAAGLCYRVTMTTQDGSTLQALFKLK